MPTYAYECQKCQKQFDIQESIDEHAKHLPHNCPKCGNQDVRQIKVRVQVRTSRKS